MCIWSRDGARKETLWDIYRCGAPDKRRSWYVYWNGDDLKADLPEVVYQKWCGEYGISVSIAMEAL